MFSLGVGLPAMLSAVRLLPSSDAALVFAGRYG